MQAGGVSCCSELQSGILTLFGEPLSSNFLMVPRPATLRSDSETNPPAAIVIIHSVNAANAAFTMLCLVGCGTRQELHPE